MDCPGFPPTFQNPLHEIAFTRSVPYDNRFGSEPTWGTKFEIEVGLV